MENILIQFDSDVAGLQPGIDGLIELGVVDAKNAEQAKKTLAEVQKRDKAISDGAQKNVSSVEKLSSTFKNLDKIIIGGSYGKSLKALQKEVDKTGDEFKQLSLVVDFTKKKLAELDPNSTEFAELSKELELSESLLKAFGEEAEETGKKTTSLKTQLRQLKEAIALGLEESGGKITPEIQDLIDRAGELDDTLKDINATVANVGSDTKNLDGLISMASGGVGVFSAFQGAIAITGDQSEETQQALVKLNAVMALLQGLQQVQNVLQKESAASQLILNAQRKIAVIQTNLQTAAESRNVVVKYAAIAAQRVLNVVMAASPMGILVGVIGAVAAGLAFFSSRTSTATEKQIELNEQLKIQLDYLDQLNESLRSPFDARIKRAEQELTLMQAGNASREQVLTKEREIASLEAQRGNLSKGFLKDQVDGLEAVTDELKVQQRELVKLKAEAQTTENDGFFSGLFSSDRSKDEIEENIKLIEGTIENLEKKKTNAEKINEEISESNTKVAAKDLEIQQFYSEQGLKSAVGFAKARVAAAVQGSREELNARIAAIGAEKRAALAAKDITAGERARIAAEAKRDIEQLQFDFDDKAREQTIKALDAKAALEKEGSRKRLDLELVSFDKQKEKELAVKGLTEQQKQEIEDRYLKLTSDKVREYAKADAEYQLKTKVAALNTSIGSKAVEADAATNQQLLNNRKSLIDAQAQLEILSINDTVHNEETRRTMVQEVYARALQDKAALEREKRRIEIESIEESAFYQNDLQQIDQQAVISGIQFSVKEKQKAQQNLFKLQRERLDAEALAEANKYFAGITSNEDYNKKLHEINKRYRELDIAETVTAEQKKEALRQQIIQTSFSLLQQLSDSSFNTDAQRRQQQLEAELDRLQKQKDQELAYAGITEDQKAQINRKYEEREKVLKRKNFEDEKQAKIAQARINGALAITNILATRPKFDLGIGDAIMIAAALATTALQISEIQKTKAPGFWTGTKKAPSGYKWVGEKGPELIYDGGGYPIIPHEKSVKLAQSNFSDPEIMRQYNLPLAKPYAAMAMPQYDQQTTKLIESYHTTESIDYNKLASILSQQVNDIGQRIISELNDKPVPGLSIDEKGFTAFTRTKNEEIEYVNKKLNL